MSSSGAAKNVGDSRTEALHALLNSLDPDATGKDNAGGKLSSDQVRKISDKLGEILGDAPQDDGTRRNEKGQLVNEEGLPIIDISEPLTAEHAHDSGDPNTISNFDDPDLLPLWTLSEEEKARRKAERERILDALEEEEREENAREAEAARAHWMEEMERRKEAHKVELENIQRARELQKKMGKALLRSVVADKDEEEKKKAEQEQADHDAELARKRAVKPKKSVTFADDIQIGGASSDKGKGKDTDVDYGDVSLGRLRGHGQPTMLTQEYADSLPMKMHVVERRPGRLRSPEPPANLGDSDDESLPDSLVQEPEDDQGLLGDHASASDDDVDNAPLPSDSDGDEGELSADDVDDWGGEDFDYARHQREIALEYYAKRKTIGAEVNNAMRAHSHDDENWDQAEVSADANLAAPPPKPSMSRFKSERMGGSTLASHSLGDAILPSSQSTSLNRAVRMGKLEHGRLVGGEADDSDGELDMADENTRAMLEMLRTGEVTNVGPRPPAAFRDVKPPVSEASASAIKATPPSEHMDAPQQPVAQPKPSKVSRFKLAVTHPSAVQPQPSGSGMNSSMSTPVNSADRSSPKFPIPRDSIPVRGAAPPTLSHAPAATAMPSTIVDSPDFPRPTWGQMPSMIVESPDFPHPGYPPASHSAGTTPSSLSPTSTVVSSSLSSPVAPVTMRSSVVERRPPTIVSAREAGRSAEPSSEGGRKQPRVSRFKAQRS